MYGKLKITATITVVTGLHIGGSNVYSAIGAVDSPVIRDVKSHLPIIPGSSLKGKLRTLMVRNLKGVPCLEPHDGDPSEITRLFGNAKKGEPHHTRLQFRDCFIENTDEFKNIGFTEIKFENTIKRVTAEAMPRQIERVIPGVKFKMKIIYDIITEDEEVKADFKNLAEGFKLLQADYLGGHGTRGYGSIALSDFRVEVMENHIDRSLINSIEAKLKEVETGAALSV
ncbi:MAG TPA: type III-A CRISPR-associated RAMP protein Csm3 [Ruminiclostridium sp.]|nr:type III-A CRISPR-associated RAMP protein Csm3 [Ruminiclostridium sp.]